MSLVIFKHGSTVPESNYETGVFYWIDKEDNTSEVWFGSTNGLIRLDNYFTNQEIEDIVSRISGAESDIENIQEIINGLNNDIENIVNNKLTWKII